MDARVLNATQPLQVLDNGPNSKAAPWNQSRELRAFLGLFYEILEEMACECYFTEKYGDECSDRHPIYWSNVKILTSMAIHGVSLSWPLSPKDLDFLDDETSKAYVEFFYRAVSKPVDGWDHPFCEGWHPTAYDKSLGQLEYQHRINNAFNQSGMHLHLGDGKVLKLNVVEQLALPELDDCGNDQYLKKRVESARTKFLYGDKLERMEALTILANMLERLKERLGNGDKRQAVSRIVAGLEMDEELTPLLDELFRITGRFSNETTVRHHEDSRISLPEHSEVIRLLFHNYYNLIALCIASLQITDNVLTISHEKSFT